MNKFLPLCQRRPEILSQNSKTVLHKLCMYLAKTFPDIHITPLEITFQLNITPLGICRGSHEITTTLIIR